MKPKINFSGLSFEVGQSKRGLSLSANYARKYFSILKNAGVHLRDCQDISEEHSSQYVKFFSEADIKKFCWQKYKDAYLKTLFLLEQGSPVLNWGGDHSIAISTVGAFSTLYPDGYVIWIDAHADLNLPQKSLSGNFHGMPLSVLCNLDEIATYQFKWLRHHLNPRKLIYLGLRDVDPFEQETISSLGITTFSMSDIKTLGIKTIISKIISKVGDAPVHISFDVDSVDPIYAPSTGVKVDRGLLPADLDQIGRSFAGTLNTKSIDIVEINPLLGSCIQVDQTYITAFYFLRSLFTHTDQGEKHESMGQRFQAEHTNAMEWGL